MTDNVTLFPSIEINVFADINTFVQRWILMYSPDRDYDFYHEHRFKKKLSEKELRRLFKWFNKGPFSSDQRKAFDDEVVPMIPSLNLMKKSGEYSSVLVECSTSMCPLWIGFLMHLVGGYNGPPLFNRDIYRAYHYMTTAELGELPDDNENRFIQHNDYTVFCLYKNEKYGYNFSNDMWDQSMSAFGSFLRDHPGMFFTGGMYLNTD